MIQNVSRVQSNTNFGKKFIIPQKIENQVFSSMHTAGLFPTMYAAHSCEKRGMATFATGPNIARFNEERILLLDAYERSEHTQADISAINTLEENLMTKDAELITSPMAAVARILSAIVDGK